MRREKAILTRRFPTKLTLKGWEYEEVVSEVRVMARAEGYAMVRHKGAVPFVVAEDALRPVEKKASVPPVRMVG